MKVGVYAKTIAAVVGMAANVLVVALALNADLDAPAIVSLLAAVNTASVFAVYQKRNDDPA